MYGDGPELRFPRLKWQKNVTAGRSKKEVSLYCLDWSGLEAWRRKKHTQWLSRHWPEHVGTYPYIDPLPTAYDEMLGNASFCITDSYHRELTRNVRRAVEEWRLRRPFDTIIRESCLGPAIAHVEVAVELLIDCLYEEAQDGDGDYDRDYDRREVVGSAILWKIWYQQTGGGLYWDRARLDELKERYERRRERKQPFFADSRLPRTLIPEFAEAMKLHWERIQAVRPALDAEAMDDEEE